MQTMLTLMLIVAAAAQLAQGRRTTTTFHLRRRRLVTTRSEDDAGGGALSGLSLREGAAFGGAAKTPAFGGGAAAGAAPAFGGAAFGKGTTNGASTEVQPFIKILANTGVGYRMCQATTGNSAWRGGTWTPETCAAECFHSNTLGAFQWSDPAQRGDGNCGCCTQAGTNTNPTGQAGVLAHETYFTQTETGQGTAADIEIDHALQLTQGLEEEIKVVAESTHTDAAAATATKSKPGTRNGWETSTHQTGGGFNLAVLEEVLRRGEQGKQTDLFDALELPAEEEEKRELIEENNIGARVHGDSIKVHNTATQWMKNKDGTPLSPTELAEVSSVFYEYPAAMETRDAKTVYLVLSMPGETGARQAIRDTWGEGSAVYFILGHTQIGAGNHNDKSARNDYTDDVAKEQAAHEDLIVVAMAELYVHAEYKMLVALHAVKYHAKPGWNYVVKTDSDCWVDTLQLEHMLRKRYGKDGKVQYLHKDFIAQISRGTGANRGHDAYSLSRAEWPYDTYPGWSAGALYIASARMIHCAVPLIGDPKQRLVHMEDVAFGMLLAPCGGSEHATSKAKASMGYDNYPKPLDPNAPFADYKSFWIGDREEIYANPKMKGWHKPVTILVHMGYWNPQWKMRDPLYAGRVLADHFGEMKKIFGQQDLVMRWFWSVPFALDWIDPAHVAWNERGAQQSIVKMHRLYKAWFDTWYDGCLGESCVVKPSPASITTFKSYVSQLPTCFAMTSDKAEVTIAAAQVCVDALVKWKARGEGLLWHSLATVKKAGVYHTQSGLGEE